MSEVGLTVFGCEPDEADLFTSLADRFGVALWLTAEAATVGSIDARRPDRCVSVSHKTRLSAPILHALHDAGVEHVSTRSVGLDHVDLDAAAELGIVVDNVGYGPDGVADFTVMLILMAVRGAGDTLRRVAQRDFRLPGSRSRDMCDLTIGVVGLGRIGRAVVCRLRGFGCRVLACTDQPVSGIDVERVPLDVLVRESDVVTLHVPLTQHTHHLIGRRQLAAMKPGAVLVNTGRGALVDSEALIVALMSGRLGGVALDVLEGEEGLFYVDRRATPIENRYLLLLEHIPNAIVTPHTAFYTQRALRDVVERTLVTCVEFERLHGRCPT